MALNHFGARHFRADHFKTITHYTVEVILEDKKTGGRRSKYLEIEADKYREKMLALYEQARRDEEEIIAVIIAAMEVIQ